MCWFNALYALLVCVVGGISYYIGKRINIGDNAVRDSEILKKYDKISNEEISKEDVYKEEKW